MNCDCSLGLAECNCCGRESEEPIPTEPADLENERRSLEAAAGFVIGLLAAVFAAVGGVWFLAMLGALP